MKNDKEKIGSFKKSAFGVFPKAIFQKVSVRGFPESHFFKS